MSPRVQLPGEKARPGKGVLIRADGAGGTKEFISWLTKRRLSYSVGFTLPFHTPELYKLITDHDAWEVALDADGDVRDGAAVAELTGLLDMTGWPDRMRVIVRRERPHPGGQLRFDDVDGYRLTAFATNSKRGQLQALELRHRRRARCEDRIRNAKDQGLRNLPLHGFTQNRIWTAIVALASEITAWAGMLAHPEHEARRWEPKAAPALHDPRVLRSPRPTHNPAPLEPVPLGADRPRRDRPAPRSPVPQRLTPLTY